MSAIDISVAFTCAPACASGALEGRESESPLANSILSLGRGTYYTNSRYRRTPLMELLQWLVLVVAQRELEQTSKQLSGLKKCRPWEATASLVED